MSAGFISKIISGGQTGVDRAALDAAMEVGIPHGGWVTRGRRAEDIVIPDKYQLKEMSTDDYACRTEKNVLDSDGTLIISSLELDKGSKLTIDFAVRYKRPFIHIKLSELSFNKAAREIESWLKSNHISVLNVAGPRSTSEKGIYDLTREFLKYFFERNLE